MLNNYRAVISEKIRLSADQYLFKLKLVEPGEINFIAGQYLVLKVNSQSRLYSIYSPDYQKNRIDLMVRYITGGLATNYFNNLKVGDQVDLQGPAGAFTLRKNRRDKIFFATYTGLAPLRSMILSCLKKNPSTANFYLFWGIRTVEDICLFEELKQMSADYPRFKFFVCLSREKNLEKIPVENRPYFRLGRIPFVWKEYFKQRDVNSFDYYLCASRQVVESLNQYLLQEGIAKENIYFEKF